MGGGGVFVKGEGGGVAGPFVLGVERLTLDYAKHFAESGSARFLLQNVRCVLLIRNMTPFFCVTSIFS